jgi:hypothetical protein
MASTQPQWQWDADRQKYYYVSLSENCWIFQDGERIYADNAGMGAFGEGGRNSHTIANRRRTFRTQQVLDQPAFKVPSTLEDKMLPSMGQEVSRPPLESTVASYTPHTQRSHDSSQLPGRSVQTLVASYSQHNNSSRWMQNENQDPVSANGNNAIRHSVYPHVRKPLDDRDSSGYLFGDQISLSWGVVPVTIDHEISHEPLFTCSRSQLHYFDPMNEQISLLVCQHILRPCRDRCTQPWEHTHIEPGPTSNPSACLYQRRRSGAQILVVDLGDDRISTVRMFHHYFVFEAYN